AGFAARRAKEYYIYFGAYTRKTSNGIYVSRMNAETGALTEPQLAVEAQNPNTQAVHPNGKFLYSVVDAGGGAQGGVASFAIDARTGKLTHTGEVSSHGVQPIYLAIDPSGRTVAVPNYSSGSVAAIPARKDGGVGESSSFIQHEGSSVNPRRQTGPHAHAVAISPDGRFLIVPDLGLDKVMIYRLDAAQAKIEASDPPFFKAAAGSGPGDFAFHPSKPLAYLISELSNSVTAFRWDSKRGALEELQTLSNLPEGFSGNNSTAEIVVHPNGKFVYGSNRGHDSIQVYAIGADGRLQVLDNTKT